MTNDFLAFDGPDAVTFRNGVYLASGDLSGDGKADLIFGGGPGGGPRILVLSGGDLLAGIRTPLANYFAGDPASRDGARVVAAPRADRGVDILMLSAAGQIVDRHAGPTITPKIGTNPPRVGALSQISLISRELVLTGTNSANLVTIRKNGQDIIAEIITGGVTNSRTFAATLIDSIRASLLEGDDAIENQTMIPMSADGGAGQDVLTGGNAATTLLGGAGHDRLLIGTGATRAEGGSDDDFFEIQDSSRGTGELVGGEGDDWIYAGGRSFTLSNARLAGGAMSYQLNSVEQAVLVGGSGDDTLDARRFSGTTQLRGLEGNDLLYGGSNSNSLSGDEGDNQLFGGDGSDQLVGGDGNDSLSGNRGDDLYFYGTAVDQEVDTVLEAANGGTDSLDLGGVGQGPDLFTVNVDFRDHEYFIAPLDGMDWVATTPNRTIKMAIGSQKEIENVSGSQASDHIMGNDSANALEGRGDYDWIEAGPGDSVFGGDGGDSLYILPGVAVVDGGTGGEYVHVSDARYATFRSNILTVNGQATTLLSNESYLVLATPGDDVIDASGFPWPVSMEGYEGPDFLIGGDAGGPRRRRWRGHDLRRARRRSAHGWPRKRLVF